MIYSIYFTGNGYISKKEGKKYVNNHLRKNLVRNIEFSTNKINILFGPNGSGKSTIIKALSAYCLCGHYESCIKDGMTTIEHYEPIDISGFSLVEDIKHKNLSENIIKHIIRDCGNEANISWDGYPVYFHNFENKVNSYHNFGDLSGGLLGSNLGSEVSYILNKKSISSGQNALYVFFQLFKFLESSNIKEYEKSIKEDLKYETYNDTWVNCFKAQQEYLRGYFTENSSKTVTLLLDEIDKNLDITSVIYLYRDILPALSKKYNIQIILVSHNPLILSQKVVSSENYNIIPLDNKYYKETNKIISELLK